MSSTILELKGKKPSDFADVSLVAELDKEGFFEQPKH
jgi:hypothetical protein